MLMNESSVADVTQVSFFVESEETQKLVEQLVTIYAEHWQTELADGAVWTTESSRVVAAIAKILNKYQEQPNLLDRHLANLLEPLVTQLQRIIHDSAEKTMSMAAQQALNGLFEVVYLLCKTRGHKTVLRLLSHDAHDLVPLLSFLSQIDQKAPSLWETRYVLLLWISLALMVPFDLKVLSKNLNDEQLVQNVLELKRFLDYPGKEYEGAALALARLLTRKDAIHQHMDVFMDWCHDMQKQGSENSFMERGIITALCRIYKLASRSSMYPFSQKVLQFLSDCKHAESSMIRKLKVKLYQRVALSLLKPKLAAWRYQRGKRTLMNGLPAVNASNAAEEPQQQASQQEDEDEEVDERAEEVIGVLLEAIQDKDTIVRWSAAKGVGRICERLPLQLAQEVIDSIVDSFKENARQSDKGWDISSVEDATWHGNCLALAELARLGLLLPSRLSLVLPWVAMSLTFDQRRGHHSIGAHVRDAASYVCWSFARAYAPKDVKDYIGSIAQNLVTASLLDREVNVRRACSAAFQENVGRHGVFPRGIELIHLTDYFLIGSRQNCFLDLVIQVAEMDEYRHALMVHVTETSIVHWDKNMRDMASKCIGLLSRRHLKLMVDQFVPSLVAKTVSNDLSERHGCLLAVGEIARAFHGYSQDTSSTVLDVLKEHKSIAQSILSVVPGYESSYLTSFGSDLTRTACLHLVSSLCDADWPLDHPEFAFDGAWWEGKAAQNSVVTAFVSFIESSLIRKEEPVQIAAMTAIAALTGWLERHGQTQACDVLLREFFEKTTLSDSVSRRGYVGALGYFVASAVERQLDAFVDVLITSSNPCPGQQQTQADPEVRRNAVQSLTKQVSWIKFDQDHVAVVQKIITCFLSKMEDYSNDTRGDVGSWAREAAMEGIQAVFHRLSSATVEVISSKQVRVAACQILKQSVEKIDRLRERAGGVLQDIVLNTCIEFEKKDVLEDCLKEMKQQDIEWSHTPIVFVRMAPLLHHDVFRDGLLEGLLISLGGLSESLVKHASEAMLDFLDGLPPSSDGSDGLSLIDFFESLVSLMQRNVKNDRVSVAVLESLKIILAAGYLDVIAEEDNGNKMIDGVFQAVRKEMFKSKDVRKLSLGIQICSQLLSCQMQVIEYADVYLAFVVKYLVHPFPAVRRMAAEELYIVMSGNPETFTQSDEIEGLLMETSWEGALEPVKPVHAKLCDLFKDRISI